MRAVSAVIEQEDADLARAIQLSLHDAQLPTSSTHHTPQPGSRLHDFQQALAGWFCVDDHCNGGDGDHHHPPPQVYVTPP